MEKVMELKEVTPTGDGYGIEKYIVSTEEVVAARIGFIATNQPEQISSLPVHGVLDSDDVRYMSKTQAEHVVAGNVALLSRYKSIIEAESMLGSGPQQTIESGFEALCKGNRQLAEILRR